MLSMYVHDIATRKKKNLINNLKSKRDFKISTDKILMFMDVLNCWIHSELRGKLNRVEVTIELRVLTSVSEFQ